jgi:hypothetical protein
MIPETKILPVTELKQKIWKGRKLPLITLCGEWLAEAGFQPDDSAMVAIYKNILIIRHVINDNENMKTD